jgi:hypothetical protein
MLNIAKYGVNYNGKELFWENFMDRPYGEYV